MNVFGRHVPCFRAFVAQRRKRPARRAGALLLAAGLALLPLRAAGADADGARELLEQAAQATVDLRTLATEFTQIKELSFLNLPLESRGRLCFSREPGSEGSERIFWEYRSPERSGFLYEHGRGSLWTGDRAAMRPVRGAEESVLRAMAAHILAWLDVRPEALNGLYAMIRLPDAPDGPGLRLTPRRGGAFFTALEVRFAPDLRQVRSLTFLEQGGDRTLLRFEPARLNEPLPPDCAP